MKKQSFKEGYEMGIKHTLEEFEKIINKLVNSNSRVKDYDYFINVSELRKKIQELKGVKR